MKTEIDQLRDALKQDSYGAFFGAGFGGALFEAFEIDKASPEELAKMAQKRGINLEEVFKGGRDARKL